MLSVVQCKGIGGDSGVRHLIQICNLATGSKVVSWTGALNSQVSGSDRPANYRLRNHCVVRIYPQVASLKQEQPWKVRRGRKQGLAYGGGQNMVETLESQNATVCHNLEYAVTTVYALLHNLW